jgi:hypothetical protein
MRGIVIMMTIIILCGVLKQHLLLVGEMKNMKKMRKKRRR